MKKNAKMLPKANTTGEKKISESVNIIRKSRQTKEQTYEESTENYGASKRIKISVKTTTDSAECVVPTDALASTVKDVDAVWAVLGKSTAYNNAQTTYYNSEDIEDAEFEEIHNETTNDAILLENLSDSQTHDENQGKVSGKTEKDITRKEYKNPDEEIRRAAFIKAKKLLGDTLSQVVIPDNVDSPRLVSRVIIDEDNYEEEYEINPQYNPLVDLSEFGTLDSSKDSSSLKDKTLKECILEYVKCRCVKKPSLKASFRSILGYLITLELKYDYTLMPTAIGEKFFEKFQCFLLNFDLAQSTIGGICLNIRAALKWAARFGAIIDPTIDNLDYSTELSKPTIALSEEDISRIKWFDLDKINRRPQYRKTLKLVRDHFLLSCYLGQRFSDMVRVEETNFSENDWKFTITQKKTGNTAVLEMNHVYKEPPSYLKVLLDKYHYKSPWTGNISNYNRYLRELAKLVGFNEDVKFEYKINGKVIKKTFKKWELISSHTARRSFITNAVKRDANLQYIKRASGHKSGSSFDKYVLLDR